MRLFGKQIVAVALAGILVSAPVECATRPMGLVLKADAATLGSAPVQSGTNVYAGDRAITSRLGQLQMKLGAAQVFLGSDSEATFQEHDQRVLVYLSRGSAGFAAQGETVLVHAAGTWIRPVGAAGTQAHVQLVSDRELLVTAKNGPLEVVLAEEVVVVPQNQTARVSVAPQDDDQDKEVEGVGKRQVRRRRLGAFFIATGTIAGIVVPVVLHNTGNRAAGPAVSPSVP